jgi:hypothetical protein
VLAPPRPMPLGKGLHLCGIGFTPGAEVSSVMVAVYELPPRGEWSTAFRLPSLVQRGEARPAQGPTVRPLLGSSPGGLPRGGGAPGRVGQVDFDGGGIPWGCCSRYSIPSDAIKFGEHLCEHHGASAEEAILAAYSLRDGLAVWFQYDPAGELLWLAVVLPLPL